MGRSKQFNLDGSSGIKDEYNLEQDSSEITRKLYAADDDEDDNAENDTFLKVFDEKKVAKEEVEQTKKLTEVKTKVEDKIQVTEEPPSRPVVEELSSVTFDDKTKKQETQVKSVLVPKFDW